MARIKNQQRYDDSKNHLLEIGVDLLIRNSFHSVGINHILTSAQIPKGSFYHYFTSKEDFGLQALHYYHNYQVDKTKTALQPTAQPAYEQLKDFFQQLCGYYHTLDYAQGCLMVNLSIEIADNNDNFRQQLQHMWQDMADTFAQCISRLDNADLGLAHLTDQQAADLLLNSWTGALARMKAEKNVQPLELFCQTFFTR